MSNKYKILLIEDEVNISNFVKTILVTNGYQVVEVQNGTMGYSLFCSHCPNLIILDLGLPDIDGMDFIKILHQCLGIFPGSVQKIPQLCQSQTVVGFKMGFGNFQNPVVIFPVQADLGCQHHQFSGG